MSLSTSGGNLLLDDSKNTSSRFQTTTKIVRIKTLAEENVESESSDNKSRRSIKENEGD